MGNWRWLGPALAVAAAVPLVVHNRYALHLLVLVFLYGSMATAWDIIGGLGGQLSLGHAVFFAIGAYTSVLLVPYGVPPVASAPLAVLMALAAALVVGYPAFRLRGAFFAMTTIAFGEILRVLLLHFQSITQGANGLSVPFLGVRPLYLQFGSELPYYYLALCLLLVTAFIHVAIARSRYGYGLRAIRDDQEAAESVGIPAHRLKLVAFLVSAAITSVAGVFYAFYVGYIDPDSTAALSISVQIAVMAIVGGMGSELGAIIGAAAVVGLSQLTNALFGASRGVSTLLYGALLMVIVLVRPGGLMSILEPAFQAVLRSISRFQPVRARASVPGTQGGRSNDG